MIMMMNDDDEDDNDDDDDDDGSQNHQKNTIVFFKAGCTQTQAKPRGPTSKAIPDLRQLFWFKNILQASICPCRRTLDAGGRGMTARGRRQL